MAATVVQSGNPTILTGGTAWATSWSGFSTTPGWRAVITDDIENPSTPGLKRLHLEVWFGRGNRKANNTAYTKTYSDAPEFTETPNWTYSSWTVNSGTGNRLNMASEASITAWQNGSFSYVSWENGTTGNYNFGLIFTFDGFTTYGYEPPMPQETLYGLWKVPASAAADAINYEFSSEVWNINIVEGTSIPSTVYSDINDFSDYIINNSLVMLLPDGTSNNGFNDPYTGLFGDASSDSSSWVIYIGNEEVWSGSYIYMFFDPLYTLDSESEAHALSYLASANAEKLATWSS